LSTSTNGTWLSTAAKRSGEVHDRAHQQAAGTASLDRETIRSHDLRIHQRVSTRDEVREGVHLLPHPTRVVPGLAELATAADMGDRHHDTALQQRQARG
jgi:hypothetical protein